MGLERKENLRLCDPNSDPNRFYEEEVELTVSLFGLGILVGAVVTAWADMFDGVASKAMGDMLAGNIIAPIDSAGMLSVMREQFDAVFDILADEAIARNIAVENGGADDRDNALAELIAAMAAKAVEEYENGNDGADPA